MKELNDLVHPDPNGFPEMLQLLEDRILANEEATVFYEQKVTTS
jgi:hypothetical protein